MIGKPGDLERQCPKCGTYGTFRVIYDRNNNRYVNIGRMCMDTKNEAHSSYMRDSIDSGCGHYEKKKKEIV